MNGSNVTYNGSFSATTTASTQSQTVNLASAVGSPEPNQCTISNLTATSLLALNSTLISDLTGISFAFGASAVADNGQPGAVYANYPADANGALAEVCVDNTGNTGLNLQAYQCNSDYAQQWLQVSTGQLVHNGECLDYVSGSVVMDTCQVNPAGTSTQVWTEQTPNSWGTLTNGSNSECLTAPSSGTVDTAALTMSACTGATGQAWRIPPVTPL